MLLSGLSPARVSLADVVLCCVLRGMQECAWRLCCQALGIMHWLLQFTRWAATLHDRLHSKCMLLTPVCSCTPLL